MATKRQRRRRAAQRRAHAKRRVVRRRLARKTQLSKEAVGRRLERHFEPTRNLAPGENVFEGSKSHLGRVFAEWNTWGIKRWLLHYLQLALFAAPMLAVMQVWKQETHIRLALFSLGTVVVNLSVVQLTGFGFDENGRHRGWASMVITGLYSASVLIVVGSWLTRTTLPWLSSLMLEAGVALLFAAVADVILDRQARQQSTTGFTLTIAYLTALCLVWSFVAEGRGEDWKSAMLLEAGLGIGFGAFVGRVLTAVRGEPTSVGSGSDEV